MIGRVEFLDNRSDCNDPDFKSRRSIIDTNAEKRITRGSVQNVLFNLAASVRVLDDSHTVHEEEEQLEELCRHFDARSDVVNKVIYNRVMLYSTSKAIWWTPIWRYNEPRLLMSLRRLVNDNDKPVTVVVGEKLKRKHFGHAVNMTILKIGDTNNRLVSIIKESSGLKDAVISNLVWNLVRELGVDAVLLIGMLEKEAFGGEFTDCIKECYKSIGNILDGNFPWELKIGPEYYLAFDMCKNPIESPITFPKLI